MHRQLASWPPASQAAGRPAIQHAGWPSDWLVGGEAAARLLAAALTADAHSIPITNFVHSTCNVNITNRLEMLQVAFGPFLDLERNTS